VYQGAVPYDLRASFVSLLVTSTPWPAWAATSSIVRPSNHLGGAPR
jgi:hypothetical protein